MNGKKSCARIWFNTVKAIHLYRFACNAEASVQQASWQILPGCGLVSRPACVGFGSSYPSSLTGIDLGSIALKSNLSQVISRKHRRAYRFPPGNKYVAVKRSCYQQLDRIRNSIRHDVYDVVGRLLNRNRPRRRASPVDDPGTCCPGRHGATINPRLCPHVSSRR